MQHQVTIPDWVFNTGSVVYHNWALGLLVVLSATVVSAVTFWANKHWSKKQQQEVLTRTLHFIMVGLVAVFGLLGQLVPFLHDNLAVFSSVPHIGEYMVTVYAAANFLYALKLKVWFQAFANWAGKKSKTDVSSLTVTDSSATVPEGSLSDGDFV